MRLLDYSLLAPWREQIKYVHNLQVNYFAEGWTPDVALEPGQPTPTAEWPFVQLEEFLHPFLGYLLLVAFGMCFIKEGRQMLPQWLTFRLKFAYNFGQIFLCSYMSFEAYMIRTRNGYSLLPAFNREMCAFTNAREPAVANLMWLFFISKIFDFADTFFIIVTGKVRQFSFLHYYHHSSICYIYHILLNAYYDGDIYFSILINSLVHSIMYTYYLITMHTGPHKIQIPWKKYLTKIQLAQFVYVVAHGVGGYFSCVGDGGPINKRPIIMYITYMVLMYGLFMHFYVAAYKKKKKKSADARPLTDKTKKH